MFFDIFLACCAFLAAVLLLLTPENLEQAMSDLNEFLIVVVSDEVVVAFISQLFPCEFEIGPSGHVGGREPLLQPIIKIV